MSLKVDEHGVASAVPIENYSTGQVGKQERTEKKVLAQVVRSGEDKNQLAIEALFKVSNETPAEEGAMRLRLWVLWGQKTITEGTVLADCEYDTTSMTTSPAGIFVAYQVTDSRPLNNHSFAVKVRSVNPRTLGLEDQKTGSEKGAVSRARFLSDIVGNMLPGEMLLLKIGVQHGEQVIDPDRFFVARLGEPWPAGSTKGRELEEGSLWREVGKINPDGFVETIAEYRAVNTRQARSDDDQHRDYEKPTFAASPFEKTSSSRKLFSLRDFKQASRAS